MKNPSLSELQYWFREVMSSRPEPKRSFAKPVHDTLGISADTRMDVYVKGYFLRLRDALAVDFEAVKKMVGAKEFDRLTEAYLSQNPSRSPLLADASRWFPDFIARSFDSPQNWMAELARLEWAVNEALYAPTVATENFELYAEREPEEWAEATAVLDPSFRLFKTHWPLMKLWRERDERTKTPAPRSPRTEYLMVFRDERWSNIHVLDAVEFEILRLLESGCTLGALAEKIDTAGLSSDGFDLQEFFGRLREQGVLRALRFKNNFGSKNNPINTSIRGKG